MKALRANFSIGKEAWDRIKSRFLGRPEQSQGIVLESVEIPEPALVSPRWVRVRSITSGISDMDEGLILDHDPCVFGVFLSFPFVPGNENVGIVTETGKEVSGMELGQRVVVDPLLSCRPRQIDPLCPSCSQGEPFCCSNFSKGVVGPGIFIGACTDTGGGWGDSFIAHRGQLYPIPHDMET
ncbi:MAG: alcohol dehydrogenase catalytic domain-containing protein, partial [Deltaproteobacteria bacterium]|nr:alcohol dehydrogenase catalytic domain-containing protein [Deltaproteobacteria bacterium]